MNKILCPIDFSETSYNGLDYAFSIAHEHQSELILLHSIHPGNVKGNKSLFEIQEEAKDKLEMICEKLASRNVHAFVSYGFVVKIGLAADEIIKLINDNSIDMIIMGTSGTTGILFNSLSADIVSETTCPVIVVPESYYYKKIQKISYATDLKGKEGKLISYVLDLAKKYGAHVDFLFIQKDIKSSNSVQQIDRENFFNGYQNEDVSFKVVEAEDIVQGIITFSKKIQTDLIVMATYDKSMLKKLFNKSYTKELLGKTSIPVLALHK